MILLSVQLKHYPIVSSGSGFPIFLLDKHIAPLIYFGTVGWMTRWSTRVKKEESKNLLLAARVLHHPPNSVGDGCDGLPLLFRLFFFGRNKRSDLCFVSYCGDWPRGGPARLPPCTASPRCANGRVFRGCYLYNQAAERKD